MNIHVLISHMVTVVAFEKKTESHPPTCFFPVEPPQCRISSDLLLQEYSHFLNLINNPVQPISTKLGDAQSPVKQS